MDIKNKADFVAFIQELRAALKLSGIIVSVSVTRTNPDPFWSGSYDRRALGKAADYMMLMAEKALNKVWDAKTKQYYLEFATENGEKHQIWIEDKQSMTLRRDLINKCRLIGAAAWHIGLETPDIWSLFQAYR